MSGWCHETSQHSCDGLVSIGLHLHEPFEDDLEYSGNPLRCSHVSLQPAGFSHKVFHQTRLR